MANNNNNIFNFLGPFNPFSWFGNGAITPDANPRQVVKSSVRLKPEESQRNSLEVTQNFSHFLALNSPVARGALIKLRSGVLGEGVKLRSEIKRKYKTKGAKELPLDDSTNKAIEQEWEKWNRAVTVDGQLSWYEATRKVLTSIAESGECFVKFYRIIPKNRFLGEQTKVRLSFQILEGDALDSTYHSQAVSDGGNYWENGIEYDKFSRPVNYAFKVKTSGDTYQTQVFDARDILHLFMADEQRPETKRGWPWLVSVRQTIDQMDAFKKVSLAHAEENATVTTYVTPSLQAVGGVAPEEEVDYDGIAREIAQGSGTVYLPPGYEVKEKSQIPLGQLEPFINSSQKDVSMSWGLSREAITNDHSGSNFSQARLATLSDVERFREIQRFLEIKFFEPCYRLWLIELLLTDPPFKISEDPNDYHHRWIFRSYPYVEVVKGTQAKILQMNAGLVSPKTVSSELGYDFEAEMRQRAIDEKVARENGQQIGPVSPDSVRQFQNVEPPSPPGTGNTQTDIAEGNG